MQERQSSSGEGGGPLSILDAPPDFSVPPASSSGANGRPQLPLQPRYDSDDANDGAGGFGPGQVAFPVNRALSSATGSAFHRQMQEFMHKADENVQSAPDIWDLMSRAPSSYIEKACVDTLQW